MRTSVTLDADVHEFISIYARARDISLSTAIGELVRRAGDLPDLKGNSARLKMSPHGYLVIAGTGNPLTPQMVKDKQEG